jgi:transposase InsO family protein
MYPVALLCRVMEVSRSGYYAYAERRRQEPRSDGEVALVRRVKAIHEEVRGSYGTRRMARQLQGEGHAVGRHKARSLMREADIEVRRKRRFRVTTDSRHRYPVAPNLLQRQFATQAPDQAWVGDITYLWTAEGWLYLAVVIDLFSRRVVGWSLAAHMRVDLVKDALTMALWRRRPQAGLIHHSDRGSQYACEAYQERLKAHGLVCSMSRKGDCWDNAVAERFFGSLKRECTDHRLYATREEARGDVVDYIEMFYNSRRRHSYLGYSSPAEFEALAKVA